MFVRLHVITWRDNTQEQPQQSEMLCVNRLTGGPPFLHFTPVHTGCCSAKACPAAEDAARRRQKRQGHGCTVFQGMPSASERSPGPSPASAREGKARRKPQLQHDIVFPCAGAVLLVGRRPGQKLCRALRAESACRQGSCGRAGQGPGSAGSSSTAGCAGWRSRALRSWISHTGRSRARPARVCAKVKPGGSVVIRQGSGGASPQGGAGFQLQQVARDMRTAAVLQKIQRGG